MLPLFLDCFDQILFILAGYDDIHKSLDVFEIRPDLTNEIHIAALERLKSRCHHFFSVAFYRLLFCYLSYLF